MVRTGQSETWLKSPLINMKALGCCVLSPAMTVRIIHSPLSQMVGCKQSQRWRELPRQIVPTQPSHHQFIVRSAQAFLHSNMSRITPPRVNKEYANNIFIFPFPAMSLWSRAKSTSYRHAGCSPNHPVGEWLHIPLNNWWKTRFKSLVPLNSLWPSHWLSCCGDPYLLRYNFVHCFLYGIPAYKSNFARTTKGATSVPPACFGTLHSKDCFAHCNHNSSGPGHQTDLLAHKATHQRTPFFNELVSLNFNWA